jgi:hypothetical protein
MELRAKLTQLLPIQTGTGKNVVWRKQDIILEVFSGSRVIFGVEMKLPTKSICVTICGDKINESQLIIGNELKIDFDIESREYNGRWYTDLNALKIEVVGTGSQSYSVNALNSESVIPGSENDILPF